MTQPLEAGGGQELMSIPGKPEVWKVGATTYLVYIVEWPYGDPIPIAWAVPAGTDLQSLFGPGRTITYDRTVSAADFESYGVIDFGLTTELANFSEDPFETWAKDFEVEASVRPWLRDPEVASLVIGALLEGRAMTDAEFQTTEWWRTHNDAQRQWALLSESDPATAQQLLEDNRILLLDQLESHGVSGVPESVAQWLADQLTMGNWSQTYLLNQVEAIADPYSGIAIDPELTARLEGVSLDTTMEREGQVAALVDEWLGPVFGAWDDDQIAKWAGVLRNSPDGTDQLMDYLQSQRLAVLPGYEDPSLTYDAIAQPWRGFWMNMWGRTADETDDLFLKVLSLNDATEAGKLLRREGLTRGVEKVSNSLRTDLELAFPTVRRAV